MRVTEQIDAMEVSGTNPFKYLVVTRVAACTFMLPVLVTVADFISLYASYIGVNIRDVVSLELYYFKVLDSLVFGDVLPALIKTYFFGFAIGIIGCYKGYYSNKGTEGVGFAANSAVVVSSLVVFILDLIAVQIADIMGLT
jgi:phospholipid/cholesterol/gamma-HCH transport system permease protein